MSGWIKTLSRCLSHSFFFFADWMNKDFDRNEEWKKRKVADVKQFSSGCSIKIYSRICVNDNFWVFRMTEKQAYVAIILTQGESNSSGSLKKAFISHETWSFFKKLLGNSLKVSSFSRVSLRIRFHRFFLWLKKAFEIVQESNNSQNVPINLATIISIKSYFPPNVSGDL